MYPSHPCILGRPQSYIFPALDRANLKVLPEAYVNRMVTKTDAASGEVVATGVEFVHKGATYVVHAKKEVILNAGCVASPVRPFPARPLEEKHPTVCD